MFENGVEGQGYLTPFSAGHTVGPRPGPDKTFEGFVLVGCGERGKLNNELRCGDIDPIFICQKDFKVHGRPFSCKQKTCPYCGDKWVLATAVKLTNDLWLLKNKLQSVIWTYNGKKYYGFRLVHIPLSTPESRIPEFIDLRTGLFNVKRFIGEGLEYLKSKNKVEDIEAIGLPPSDPLREELILLYRNSKTILAGVLIFHPHRPNERYYEERREEREEGDDNPAVGFKKWEWIKSKPNWRDYVRFSPHSHFVGLVAWLEPPKKGEKWIYKLVGDSRGIKSKDDLFAVLYYLLTHTGVQQPHDRAYVRVGLLAPRKFNRGWAFKAVKAYFQKFGLEDKEILKKKFGELKKLIEEDEELKPWEKEALIVELRMYRHYMGKRLKRLAYKCKICGNYLTGIVEGLRAYFRALLRLRWEDPLKLYPIKQLKLFVLRKDEVTPFAVKANILEALDILSGWKPPPESIPVVG